MAPAPPVEEGKLLTDALGTVKIQVVQMKRHLVSHPRSPLSTKLFS
jgi:hypothetical protein